MRFPLGTKNLLKPTTLASAVTGLLFFVLVTQVYINERFSLLERASLGLILLIVVVYFTKSTTNVIFISVPAAGLTITMGISLVHIPATFIIRDFVAYLLIAIFAVILISIFGIAAARNGIVFGLTLLLFANVILLLTSKDPDFIGAVRFVGTSYGSNTLAASIIVCAPAVLSLKTQGSKVRMIAKWFIFALSTYFIFLTEALTALVTLTVIIFIWVFYWCGHKFKKLAPWLWVLPISLAALVVTNFNLILTFLNKGPSLSGRVPLWNAYLDKIGENPILGYGWSFQTRTDMPLGLYVYQETGFPLSNAHNDLLNWWAQTGIFGALFYLISLFVIVFIGFRARKFSIFGLWLGFTGIAIAINGLTELSSMYADGWMVLMICSVAIVATIREQKHQNTISRLLFICVDTHSSNNPLKR